MPFDNQGLDDANGGSVRYDNDFAHLDLGLSTLAGSVALGALGIVSHRTASVADNTEVSAVFPAAPAGAAGIAYRLVDAFVVKRVGAGAAGDQVIVTRNGNTVVAAITLNLADRAVGRALDVDDAQTDFVAGDALGLHFDLGAGGNNASDVHLVFKRIV